jgi:UDP-3-O-[3-hydroxymyristoyl] glucosamine N-acyltransferase
MAATLSDLARLAEGDLTGDAHLKITGAATIRDAKPGEITLADCTKLLEQLPDSQASAVIVSRDATVEGIPSIAVDDVHEAFAKVVRHFCPPRRQRRIGISPLAHVSPLAIVGDDVDIHPGASVDEDVVIGNGSTIHAGAHIMAGCRLGDRVTLFPGAVLYENTVVGHRCIIHANAVVGAYGFGYETTDGRHVLSEQLGFVIIGDDVEIGACSTVDRGTYGPTTIGDGTKIDNQVMVAHNCRIGRHNMLCSQVGVAGSVTTGDYVVMAGQVGIRDHVDIGNQAVLGAKAGVMGSVPDGETYVGIPATPWPEQRQKQVLWARLPEMRKQLRQLQKTVDQLAAPPDQHKADAA